MRHLAWMLFLTILVAGCGQPPAEPPRQTSDNRAGWRKLTRGMSPDGVRQLLGEPTRVEKQDTVICWHYQEGRPLETDAADPNRWILARGALLFSTRNADRPKLTAWREP
jgi:hypothetical protein